MTPVLHYLFDPLCGWCYGAAPAVSAVAETEGITLRLLPSGLFSGRGARPMDDDFAAYAWSNDQRIERLTGQPFSALYRQEVLADRRQRFDSGPATLALSAVAATAPARELAALKAIQHARYVDGRDITRLDVLTELLQGLALYRAAASLPAAGPELLEANRQRTAEAQALMQQAGVGGVPTFILETAGVRRVLDTRLAYADPRAFAQQALAA